MGGDVPTKGARREGPAIERTEGRLMRERPSSLRIRVLSEPVRVAEPGNWFVLGRTFHVKPMPPGSDSLVTGARLSGGGDERPHRGCNPRSVAAIRVERGPERSGCFT